MSKEIASKIQNSQPVTTGEHFKLAENYLALEAENERLREALEKQDKHIAKLASRLASKTEMMGEALVNAADRVCERDSLLRECRDGLVDLFFPASQDTEYAKEIIEKINTLIGEGE